MPWTKRLTQLNDVLSDLIPHTDGIIRFVKAAGLKPQFIVTNGNAMDVWSSVLSEADKHNKVDDLIKSVLSTYPENPFLKSALLEKEIDYSLSPDLDEISKWESVSSEELELLTMGKSTLLPINFLSQGIQKSKAVGKVEIKTKSGYTSVGTGFLIKVKDIEDLFFITNYHVISSEDQIDKTKIIFDFELDINGDSLASKSFNINKNGSWYCSPVHECDATIFQLVDKNNELKDYGFIELEEIEVSKNDFVNIIQHPGGDMKQISLYHNIVTYSDDRVVQYLTDTLKGSSGAPVFNSDWEVVALHHSGSEKKNGENQLPLGAKSRNEGIYINKIIQFIKESYKN